MKAAKYLLPFAAAALLGACSTVGGMPRGQQTADYKIEAAGEVQAEVGRSAANSSYRYGFGIRLKNAPRVASVKIERTRGGELGVVFDDSRHPTTATQTDTATGAVALSSRHHAPTIPHHHPRFAGKGDGVGAGYSYSARAETGYLAAMENTWPQQIASRLNPAQ